MGSKETPRLSPSIAHSLVTESPLQAWADHRLLGNRPRVDTEAQVEGRLWHTLILGGGTGLKVIDADSFRTKDAWEARDAALADGLVPILAAKHEEKRMQAAVIKREIARLGIELDGSIEQRVEWDEWTDGHHRVECSGFIDHWSGQTIDDLKTTKGSVTPEACAAAIARSHGVIQDAAYRRAIAETQDIDESRLTVRFIFAQTVEPFAVTPVTLSGEFREIGRLRWRRAINTWHACLSRSTHREDWPGPVPGIVPVHPPGWLLAREIAMEEMG